MKPIPQLGGTLPHVQRKSRTPLIPQSSSTSCSPLGDGSEVVPPQRTGDVTVPPLSPSPRVRTPQYPAVPVAVSPIVQYPEPPFTRASYSNLYPSLQLRPKANYAKSSQAKSRKPLIIPAYAQVKEILDATGSPLNDQTNYSADGSARSSGGIPVSLQSGSSGTNSQVSPTGIVLEPIPRRPGWEHDRPGELNGSSTPKGLHGGGGSSDQGQSSSESPSSDSQRFHQHTPFESSKANCPNRWYNAYSDRVTFYINRLTPTCFLPPQTIRWCRNASDERAAQEGMRFVEEVGQFVVDWVQSHCILYEGSRANESLICDDWQYEYFMQMFGWLRLSEEVGRWLRRFTHAGVWIAKKNAKSPTLAATGLYMFVGDGEQGQHCYSVAKDGKQALIAHTHAIEMVNNSPKLASEIRHRKTDNALIHRKSKSTYVLVAGDNKRAAESTEGFNGSLFVDETHVVDQQHMDRLKRAGISRDEPVHVEMSTAGNNADGYGYNRYQYGQRVSALASPNDYNPHFLFIDYSTDQSVTIDKLRDRDFVERIAPLCNPAMGRIIKKYEFLADYQDSLKSDTELRNFAMYRLNLWLNYNAVWIELADWLRCAESPIRDMKIELDVSPTNRTDNIPSDYLSAQFPNPNSYDAQPDPLASGVRPSAQSPSSQNATTDSESINSFVSDSLNSGVHATSPYRPHINQFQYTLSDLAEYPCVGGLDMSIVKDMTALTLIFAVPDDILGVRPYTWTWHWLPELTALSYQGKVDLWSPKLAPFITLLKQPTIDFEVVATKLEWVRSNLDFRCLGYDVFNSVPLINCLINDYGWDELSILKVPQQLRVMGPITKLVERWIVRHEIHHPNNELLNWQFQHTTLEDDKHGNYKVVKPHKDDYRKVDGVVSMLIASIVLTLPELGLWSRDSGSILLYERKPKADGGVQEIGTTKSYNEKGEWEPALRH